MLLIPCLPVRNVQKSLTRSASVLQVFVSPSFESEGDSFPVTGSHGLFWPQVLFKATCFITVEVRLNNTSNEQQIHNSQILIFSASFFLFVFFFFFFHKMPFMSTAQRLSLLNISLRNKTFCFWDQLVGGWPLFSPPGASIGHAGPGPVPKRGQEPEPRRWRTDRQSDPLAGPGFCPGHRLLVQDTKGA